MQVSVIEVFIYIYIKQRVEIHLVQRCLVVTSEGRPCRFRSVAAVLRVPQSLCGPSLRSHRVPMKRLMLHNLFSMC